MRPQLPTTHPNPPSRTWEAHSSLAKLYSTRSSREWTPCRYLRENLVEAGGTGGRVGRMFRASVSSCPTMSSIIALLHPVSQYNTYVDRYIVYIHVHILPPPGPLAVPRNPRFSHCYWDRRRNAV